MPAGNRPKYSIKQKRKDGAPITYVNYAGATVTEAQQPVASLFENKFGGLDVVFDKGFHGAINTADFFYNAYNNEKKGEAKSDPRKTKPAEDDLPF